MDAPKGGVLDSLKDGWATGLQAAMPRLLAISEGVDAMSVYAAAGLAVEPLPLAYVKDLVDATTEVLRMFNSTPVTRAWLTTEYPGFDFRAERFDWRGCCNRIPGMLTSNIIKVPFDATRGEVRMLLKSLRIEQEAKGA